MAITRMHRLSGAAGAGARNHPRRLRGNSIRPRRHELAAAGVSGADPARADAEPVSFKSNVKNGASKVKVDTVVTVSATSGTLTKVNLSYSNKDADGRAKQARSPERSTRNTPVGPPMTGSSRQRRTS